MMRPGLAMPLSGAALLLLATDCRCHKRGRKANQPPRGRPTLPEAAPRQKAPDAAVHGPLDAGARRGPAPEPGPADGGAAPQKTRPDAAPPRRAPILQRRGDLIDISVYRMDVRVLLQRLARATRTNLVLFNDVTGRVTVQLRGVALSQALEVVARAVGCTVTRSGNVVQIRAGPPGQ